MKKRRHLGERKTQRDPNSPAKTEALHAAGNMPVKRNIPSLAEKHRNPPGVIVVPMTAYEEVQIASGNSEHGEILFQGSPLSRIEKKRSPRRSKNLGKPVFSQKIAIFRIVIHHDLYLHKDSSISFRTRGFFPKEFPGTDLILFVYRKKSFFQNFFCTAILFLLMQYNVPCPLRQRTDTKGRNFMTQANRIRNVAIVAHIDHGKTTLIDAIFRASHTFRENARIEERVMDNNALERERGITIRAKHCTVAWEDYQINIIDTPGHADFSGEVERVLSMVDSVLLLVDACEGPMPQTRYVLMRALALGYNPMVFINKVDRRGADPDLALDKTFDLFLELGATDEQADFPVLYGSALRGWASKETNPEDKESMEDLFRAIIDHVPPPAVRPEEPFLMQISTLAWNDYIGRIGCGKILQGSIARGEAFTKYQTAWISKGKKSWEVQQSRSERTVHLWTTQGLERTEMEEAHAGDIVWIAGPEEIGIGDTFASPELENPALPPLDIEEPTVSMFFLVNNGPFAGQEGRAITLRQLRERLEREQKVNVGLRVEDLGRPDGLKVSGRGEMHLGILIEEMRREGLEFCVSPPEVITTRDAEGNLLEPIEQLIVDIPEEFQGAVIEKLARRKGELLSVHVGNTGTIRLEFSIPTRGLIGYRNDFLTDTKGLGIMSSRLLQYDLWRGDVSSRTRGSMVSMETGEATSYQLENLQERGTLFVSPMDRIYTGMIVGENSRPNDMPCNPTKRKQATNHRSSTKDFTVKLDVPRKMGLEKALEWISEDELVEVTPKSIRLRKIILDDGERRKAAKKLSA